MNKEKIIEAIAYGGIEDAKLTEATDLETGVRISTHSQGNMSGGQIILARTLVQMLTTETAELPNEPNSELLTGIHEALIRVGQASKDACIMPFLEEEAVEDHRAAVERLRTIAKDLGIAYTEPPDPILS